MKINIKFKLDAETPVKEISIVDDQDYRGYYLDQTLGSIMNDWEYVSKEDKLKKRTKNET